MTVRHLRRSAAKPAMVFALALIALLPLACGGSTEGERRVRGEIIDVVPQSIDTFESLTIRDSGGVLWTFGPARLAHFTPSHLIEHQAAGDRITVIYRENADGSRTVLGIEE